MSKDMSCYKIILEFEDGTKDEQDEIFETYEDAEEYVEYLCGCYKQGTDILNMSNPGDYPETGEDVEIEYKIIKD